MEEPNSTPLIEISASTLDIDAIVASFADDTALKESVRCASVLIVPTDLGSEYEGPAFPLSTREIFKLLRAGFDEKGTVEVAVKDDDFKPFDYRSDWLTIPTLYISSHVLVPLTVTLLGAYIYDRFKNRNKAGTVKSEIHFTDPAGAQIHWKYDGPSSTYEKESLAQLRELGVWLEGDKELDDDK